MDRLEKSILFTIIIVVMIIGIAFYLTGCSHE